MNDWERILAESGHRITVSRRAVMAALQQVDVPLDAVAILAHGQRYHSSLGLSWRMASATILAWAL